MFWKLGRQNTGYYKHCIFSSKFLKLDSYILKFEPGTSVPWHIDPTKLGKHYRANISIKPMNVHFKNKPFINFKRFHFFRPDINPHSMDEVTGSTLYILSIGKVITDQ